MDFTKIGQLKKAYGLQGQLRVFIEEPFWEDVMAANVLFIELKGQKIPYFIENIDRKKGDHIKFEEVDNKEAATKLSNKIIFIRTSDLIPAEKRTKKSADQMTFLVGFELVTKNEGRIGEISEVIEMPMQIMLSVQTKEKEILIPLVDDFIEDVFLEKKQIVMNLPEGILDL